MVLNHAKARRCNTNREDSFIGLMSIRGCGSGATYMRPWESDYEYMYIYIYIYEVDGWWMMRAWWDDHDDTSLSHAMENVRRRERCGWRRPPKVRMRMGRIRRRMPDGDLKVEIRHKIDDGASVVHAIDDNRGRDMVRGICTNAASIAGFGRRKAPHRKLRNRRRCDQFKPIRKYCRPSPYRLRIYDSLVFIIFIFFVVAVMVYVNEGWDFLHTLTQKSKSVTCPSVTYRERTKEQRRTTI